MILGIDVGNQGALALLTPEGELVEIADMPVLRDGPKTRPAVNAALLAGIIYRWHGIRNVQFEGQGLLRRDAHKQKAEGVGHGQPSRSTLVQAEEAGAAGGFSGLHTRRTGPRGSLRSGVDPRPCTVRGA